MLLGDAFGGEEGEVMRHCLDRYNCKAPMLLTMIPVPKVVCILGWFTRSVFLLLFFVLFFFSCLACEDYCEQPCTCLRETQGLAYLLPEAGGVVGRWWLAGLHMQDVWHKQVTFFPSRQPCLVPRQCDSKNWRRERPDSIASFPGSSAPEREIELVHAERAWYFFSRENPQRYVER